MDWSNFKPDGPSAGVSSNTDWGNFVPEKPVEQSGFLRRAADVPLGLAKGVADLPGAAVGILDTFTGGTASNLVIDPLTKVLGEAADSVGMPSWARPTQWAKSLSDLYSPEAQAALKASNAEAKRYEELAKQNGDGGWGQIYENAKGQAVGLYENPAAAVPLITENWAGMKAIAGVVKRILKPMAVALDVEVKAGKITETAANKALSDAAVKYAAAGEGVLTTGQVGQTIQRDDPNADFMHRLAAVPAGAITAGISRGVGKIPGLGDAEASMAMGALKKEAGFAGTTPMRAAKGFLSEGILQEGTQSPQEEIWGNIGASKPWQEGVGASIVQGIAAGGPLGAYAGVRHGDIGGHAISEEEPSAPPPPPPPPASILDASNVDAAIKTFGESLTNTETPIADVTPNTSLLDSLRQTGQQWRDLEVTPTGDVGDIAAHKVGQQWQDIAPEQSGSLEQQRLELEQAAAARSRARDAQLASMGKQWQDLGITNPADDLQAQKMGMREEPNGTSDSVQSVPVGRSGDDGVIPTAGVATGMVDDQRRGNDQTGRDADSVGQSGELPGEVPQRPITPTYNPQPTSLGTQISATAGPGFTAKDVYVAQVEQARPEENRPVESPAASAADIPRTAIPRMVEARGVSTTPASDPRLTPVSKRNQGSTTDGTQTAQAQQTETQRQEAPAVAIIQSDRKDEPLQDKASQLSKAEQKDNDQRIVPMSQREGAQRHEVVKNVVEVPVASLKLSSDIPQFKEGADANGITQRLEGKYDRALAAPVQVWQRNNGDLEMISGRHRFDLAQRSGENTIPAQIHKESDGFNKDQARMLDIELNVKDGRGKVKDYVNYFKEFKLSAERAKASGLLNTAVGRQAYTLAHDGSQSLIAAHQNNAISDEAATSIAQNAPSNEALQNLGMKYVADGKSINFAVNVMRSAKAAGFEGGTNGDMFGFDDSFAKEAEAVSNQATKQQSAARQQLAAIQGAARRPELARAGGVNVNDQKATEAKIAELKQRIADLEGFATNPQVYRQLRIDAGLSAQTSVAPVEAQREPERGNDAQLTLTAPSRREVIAQQDALDAEAKRKEEGGDKPLPRRQLTGDVPDMFNTQGSVFDQPAEPTPQTPFTYINGDRAEYTGKTEMLHGGLFHEVKFTEGAKAGKTAVTQRAPDGTNPAQKGPTPPSGIVTPQIVPAKPASEAAAILDAANVKGKERIDVLKDVKNGDITPEELKAAYPAKVDDVGEKAQASEPASKAAVSASKTPLFDAFESTMQAVRDGTATPEQFKESFESVVANEAAIKTELATKTKEQLLKDGGPYLRMRYANETKSEIIDVLYREIVGEFALGQSFSYGMERGVYQKAVRRLVEATDADKLARYVTDRKAAAEEYAAQRAAKAAALENPQTLTDYRSLIQSHINEGKPRKEAFLMLTPEQRMQYDTLEAESTKEARESRKRAAKTEVRTAGQSTGGEIIATKHTRDGYDLFVVQLSDRLSREDYQTVLASAKKLGGWYSAFRGNGAVPGFQFKSKENAQAFLALAGGDATQAQEQAAQRRDAFEDDRSQSAAERLNEMADKLTEAAEEELGRDRKVNTARRARFASAAINAAEAGKALAKTMRNIAQAISEGKAKFLDTVRTKTQVEMLSSAVRTARDNELRAKYESYADQEKRKGEPATAETADFAEFPTFTAFRSDLATLARQMLEVEGAKKLGQQLMKVADDVTDTYLDFAKGNLLSVSQFGRSGQLAEFGNKDTAEAAIRRSGLVGKAIVLPVKRGVNRVILSPSEAMNRGIWKGDGDKRITLSGDFGNELVEAIGRRGSKKNGLSVPWQFQNAYDRRKALARIGVETPSEFRSALREFIALQERALANKVREMELAMVGRKADGLDFFPTPAEVADQMVEAADIKPDMAILEPSAGMGHIAERIREAGVEPDVVEMSNDRRALLEEKGFNLVASDFMDTTGQYDRIVMNPPFSNRRDAQHVQHAYTLLKPGGRIVAIMGDGVFFGQDKKAQEFREWLDSVGGTSEKLPAGTFMDPSLPVNTSANARMVVIERGDEDAASFSRSTEQQALSDISDNNDLFLYKRGRSKQTGLTPAQFTAELTKAFGAKVAERLQAKGVVVPLADQSQLPGHVVPFLRDGDIVYGFYDPKTDRTYAVLENLTPDMVKGLVLHEVGVHFGLKAMLGDAKYRNVMQRLEVLRKAGNAAVKAAHAEAKKNAVRDSQVPEETMAYLTQNHPEMGIVKEIIAKIKAFLFNEFGIGGKYLTEADLTMLARAAVDHASRQEDGGSLVPAFMRGTNDGMTNTNVVGNQGGRSADDTTGADKYQMAGAVVDGREVRDHVPNMSSIASSLDDYTVLNGVREVPMSDFRFTGKSYSVSETKRIENLAAQIKASGEINPLIVVIDKEGPYVLEGGHRAEALFLLGAKSFPAIVVLDEDNQNEPTAPDSGGAMFGKKAPADALLAPNGKPSNLTPGQYAQVRTPEFKAWFGDWENDPENASKAVDENGEPLVVFHGTANSFDKFNVDKRYGRQRYYFAEDAGVSSEYAGQRDGANILPVFLSMQAPFDFDADGYTFAGVQLDGFPARVLEAMNPQDVARGHAGLGEIINAAEAAGYDGVLARNIRDGAGKYGDSTPTMIAVAFNPTQIKSAIGNNGQFDPKNPDIRFSRSTFARQTQDENGNPEISTPSVTLKFSQPTERLEFIPTTDNQEMFNMAIYSPNGVFQGVVEVLFTDGKPSALYDILITDDMKGAGFGTKTVEALIEASEGAKLGISNIVPSAQGFWEKLGIGVQNHEQGAAYDGTVTRESFASSPAGKKYGRAPSMGRQVQGARDGNASRTIRYSRAAAPASIQSSVTDTLKAVTSPLGTVSLWDKTVGTKYNLATKDKDFKRVFDAFRQQTDDTAHYAIEAEKLAPDVLLRMDSMKDVFGALFQHSLSKQEADLKAIAGPLFANIEGEKGIKQVRYTDAQLAQQFKLTPKQILMYHQVRGAVDTSIDRLAQTFAAQMGQTYGMDISKVKNYSLEDTVEAVKQHIQDEHDQLRGAQAQQVGAGKISAPTVDDTKALLTRLDQMEQHATFLKDSGYMPAMRFGEFAVTVLDANDEVEAFHMFDTKTEAKLAAMKLRKKYPGSRVESSVMNPKQFAMFKGVSPETVELFAKFTGMDSNADVQQYIALSKSARSVAQRELQRKGTAGFSEDVTRVLASFLTSNARQAAINMNQGDVTDALSSKALARKGDVQVEAQKLDEYMSNPIEEARRLRGFMFMHFIGGSFASAIVNLTQPVMQTTPYLHQFAGAKIARIMAAAAKMAATGKIDNQQLRDAAKRAAEDGITEPNEIHALMADAGNTGLGSNIKVRAIIKAWGGLFSATEAYNRRLTFLAAYQTAMETNQADPYAFAQKAVIETQGLYSKVNRPNWARGAVGATVFTFKQFSIAYMEFLSRLPLKQKILALTILTLAAGLQGLPGADDLEDLIDTLGQSLGYNINSKKLLRKELIDALGKDIGTVLDVGVLSALSAVDVQGRLGMGNLIPGTGMFKPSETDKSKSMAELAGPIAGLLTSAQKAVTRFQTGDVAGSLGEVAPVAVRNLIKGLEMHYTGTYKDAKGYKVTAVTAADSFIKMLGFQPSDVAMQTRALSDELQSKNMTTLMESLIAERMAQGYHEKDFKKVADARRTLNAWNENNPESRIVINPNQIRSRVVKMEQTRAQRFIKTVPKEQRRQVAEELS